MNLQQLYYFRTLAEVKHFTKASTKLMVAQPSLSHSINDLEAELGVCLFNRTNRQVSLTKYGELFLEYVSQALETLDTAQLKLNDFISPEQGTVSLHYVSSVGPFIPFVLARYFEDTGLQTTFQLKNDTNIIGSVAANLGVALAPEPLGGNQYNIKALRVKNDIPEHGLYIKWKDVKYISPAVCTFRDYLIGHPGLFEEFRNQHG